MCRSRRVKVFPVANILLRKHILDETPVIKDKIYSSDKQMEDSVSKLKIFSDLNSLLHSLMQEQRKDLFPNWNLPIFETKYS